MIRKAALILATLALSACSSSPHAVAPATDAERSALLGRIKTLAGTWEMTDDKGQVQTSVFTVSSNGSAVREIMMPGTQHEMTNMYHMDGPTLVMTHYCAMGNQPRLRADAGGPADRITLKCDSVTNWTAPEQAYMGGLTIEFKDSDTIVERWTSFGKGTEDEHAVFEMKRKKS